ncbi:MAG: hypothetical protein K2X82_07440 [Gemmataceae bacterium]|nr:hypothetical protein [Gemmataceae bacterium]
MTTRTTPRAAGTAAGLLFAAALAGCSAADPAAGGGGQAPAGQPAPIPPQPPPGGIDWTGKVTWAEKYPKTVRAAKDEKAGVMVLGEYAEPKGWTAESAVVQYMSKTQGGGMRNFDEVRLQNGKFGAIDPKTKAVVPVRVPTEAGEWVLWVLITYERKEGDGVAETAPITSPLANLTVEE